MLPSYIRPSRETVLGVAQNAERLGFDSVWTNSHTVVPASFKPRYPYAEDGVPSWTAMTAWADAMVTLGFVAATTERVRLGVAVVPLIITDPITLAKQSATVAPLSNGRLELGLGAGRPLGEGPTHGHPPSPWRWAGQRGRAFCGRVPLDALADRRDPLAPADAERRESVALLPLPQFVRERKREPSPRCAEGMPERDRAAVHVRLLAIEAEVLFHREVLRREGLVDLDEVHVLDFQAGELERLARRRCRTDA